MRILPDTKDPMDPKLRAACGKISGIVGIIANFLLCIGKILVGTLSGSLSITADGLNNLSDASASILTLVGFRIAGIPADKRHPFGHARAEYLTGLGISAMILCIGLELLRSSVHKIFHPEPAEFSLWVVLVLVLSIFVKLWLCRFHRKLSDRIGSAALRATATDSRNDAISTSAVLAAAILSNFTSWNLDGPAGLFVSVLILSSGWSLAKETIDPLLGQAGDPALRREIGQLICKEPQVLGFHDLLVHDYGPGQRFASVHVEMSAKLDPMESHGILDGIERRCFSVLGVHLCTHYDPVALEDPERIAIRGILTRAFSAFDPRISFHDLRLVSGETETSVLFDLCLPYGMENEKEALRTLANQAVSHYDPRYSAVITFDGTAFNPSSNLY